MVELREVLLFDPAPIDPPLIPLNVQLALQVVLLLISHWDPGDAAGQGVILNPGNKEVLE